MSCDKCPCPDICLGWPVFCEWAAKEPQQPVEIRHICARSAIGSTPAPSHDGAVIVEPSYPSLIEQAGNLAGAIGRAAVAALTHEPIFVDADEISRRQAICDACEFYDAARRRCTKCGCGGAKLALATESCPIGKW